MERPPVRYGTPNVDLIRSRLSRPAEEDGPFRAVNRMKYRPVADDGPGGGLAISGREADDRYTPHEALAGIGAVIALAADVDRQEAGMESTIAMCCTPDGGTAPTTPPGTLLMRVMRFAEGAASRKPAPRTDETVAAFGVEGVIVGDGRRWDRVRFDVVHDEDALAASGGMEEGVEETIAMTLRPILDSLTDTIREATRAGRPPR